MKSVHIVGLNAGYIYIYIARGHWWKMACSELMAEHRRAISATSLTFRANSRCTLHQRRLSAPHSRWRWVDCLVESRIQEACSSLSETSELCPGHWPFRAPQHIRRPGQRVQTRLFPPQLSFKYVWRPCIVNNFRSGFENASRARG